MLALLLAAAGAAAVRSDMQPNRCGECEDWNRPQAPFRIHGDSWYVGTQGLSAVLVDTGEGLLLLDGGLPQSAAGIAANIESLGFALAEVRWILNSHAHFDHAGGIAALQRLSGARVGAGPEGAEALRRGDIGADDPQHGMGEVMRFPAVPEVEAIEDGGTVRVGSLTITRHATPGHTPGGSSWSWRSCEDGECLTMVYADSLSPVSADGFRFGASGAGATLARSIARVAGLRCGVLVATHPSASGVFERLAARADSPDANPFVDPAACSRYAARFKTWLAQRLAQEQASG